MSPSERARNQGYAAGTFLVAALIGPLLGGFIVDISSWRWIFLINIPFGIMASLIASIVTSSQFLNKRDATGERRP